MIRKVLYIIILITMPLISSSQTTGEDIKREVKLYNPFKPSLNKASKISLFPEISDTTFSSPEFNYTISPKAFLPEYKIRTISPARLQPDPLHELYKGYLKLGFGNYFSPYGELSISSDRSRKSIAGFYARHESSYGDIMIEDDTKVYGGYMDNSVRLFMTKLMNRSAITGTVDFNHFRRYAYGGDPVLILPENIEKDSLKIEYVNPGASLNIYSTRLDSSKLYYDVELNYDLLYQTSIFYQHSAGLKAYFGYDMEVFYAQLGLGYRTRTITNIEDKFRHQVLFTPNISRKSDNWLFKLGLKLVADARYYDYPTEPEEYKTRLFFHPDLRFQFSVIPSIFNMYVGLDGEYSDNNAAEIIYTNPFIITHNTNGLVEPDEDLYTILPTNIQLRFNGGFAGFASQNISYGASISYSLFEDMVFFTNDQFQGRGFEPVYDNGELLELKAELKTKINDKISLSAKASYYDYTMEIIEHPWHKPQWDGNLLVEYNLRNKILINASLTGLSKRYARFGPMSYSGNTDYEIMEIPVYIGANLGFEYRYTKILSFWARLNNLALERYYEWNLYPSQRFLFMAGFTYSL